MTTVNDTRTRIHRKCGGGTMVIKYHKVDRGYYGLWDRIKVWHCQNCNQLMHLSGEEKNHDHRQRPS